MLIEGKIKEYIKYDGNLDLWDNIPTGCKLTRKDFEEISELLADAILYKKGMQNENMDIKFSNKIKALDTKLSSDELITLVLSLK